MATPISFRPNEDDLRNLAVLEASGISRTDAIRRSLADAAQRRRRAQSLAREAKQLASDDADRAEVAAVREFIGDRFGELPE